MFIVPADILDPGRALDNLVKFAAIEPNPSTFGTIVNLDVLTLGQSEFCVAIRTVHQYFSSRAKPPGNKKPSSLAMKVLRL